MQKLTSIALSYGNIGMGDAAIALAISGFAVGMVFRLKVLLSFIALLLVVSVIFSVARGFTFLEAALTVMAAQSIFQGCYFLGLVVRAFVGANQRTRPIL